MGIKNDEFTKTGSEQTQEKVEGKGFFCRDATLHRHGGLLRYAYCFAHHDDNDMPTRANCLSAPFPRSKWTEACLLPFAKTRLGLQQSKELMGYVSCFHLPESAFGFDTGRFHGPVAGCTHRKGAKNGIFFGVFPMFVPSLSWQNDRFYI